MLLHGATRYGTHITAVLPPEGRAGSTRLEMMRDYCAGLSNHSAHSSGGMGGRDDPIVMMVDVRRGSNWGGKVWGCDRQR